VVPGETGYVVDSVMDIVEGLELILSDRRRALEMGAKGRERVVEEYVWDRVVSRLESGFRS
jgi:glycosyltransferase involved in cell wall biosynthesis